MLISCKIMILTPIKYLYLVHFMVKDTRDLLCGKKNLLVFFFSNMVVQNNYAYKLAILKVIGNDFKNLSY